MVILAPTPEQCLNSTSYIDSDHPEVINHARRACDNAGAKTPRDQAVALFLTVRDGIRYDPYSVSPNPEHYKASHVLTLQSAYCIPKAVLLTALCRSVGIPSRLGFADVRNHLQSETLAETMGTDLFVYHGYSELWLDKRWVKVSSAFNIELCKRFATKVLDFDGVHDALMHPYDVSGNQHMEYVRDRGSFDDLPLEEILETFAVVYGATKADSLDTSTSDPAFD